jgi:hypothetical protein
MRKLAILAFSLTALPIQAAVTLDAQTREVSFDSLRVHTEAVCITPQSCSVIAQTNTPDAGSETAPGFDPFSAALSSSIFPSVAVSQESTITPSRMRANASHAAAGFASLGTTGGVPPTFVSTTDTHETRSLYHVEFTLDAPTGYLLDGTIVGGGAGFIGTLDMEIALRHANGEIVHRIALESDPNCFGDPSCSDLGPLSLFESGTLAPGSYVLEAEIHGQTGVLISLQLGAFANSHTGSFDVDLQLGEAVPIPPFVAPVLALALAAAARRRLAR